MSMTIAKPEDPVIDMSVISELQNVGGPRGAQLLQRILELFVNHSRVATGQIAALSQSSDLIALADAAHALKSMCASVGARRALAACHDLERSARGDHPADPRELANRVSSEMAAALRAAEALRAA